MCKPYLFADPPRILSSTWMDFAAACFEYEVPTDTSALAVISVWLDAAILTPLVARVKAEWELHGTLLGAMEAVSQQQELSPADALRLKTALEACRG